MRNRFKYEHTIYACYLGYIVQAIVNNFAPLLFLTFMSTYDISLEKIAIITTVNFCTQLVVDLLAARYIDKIGYKKCTIVAHCFCSLGLVGLVVFPTLFWSSYVGLLVAVMFYAIGGGIIEVVISPIVQECPSSNKEAAMSLLHSFYCWGHMGVVLISAIFFYLFGIQNWRYIAFIWAIISIVNGMFFALVPIPAVVEEKQIMSVKTLFRKKEFWIFFLLMVCSGASEQGMSQWASAFTEKGLHISKVIGDIAGPCCFALFMGTSRALFAKYSEKITIHKGMAGSAILCIGAYLLASLSNNPYLALVGCIVCGFSVGIFWPGSFSLSANAIPMGGTAMFAFLALAGDSGCATGPTLVGFVAEHANGSLQMGILSAVIYPLILLVVLAWIIRKRKKVTPCHN